MNYTLQVHGERSLYQVPPGLYELMSDISREVLRDQPDQIYKYIANYMDTLLNLRTNMKKAIEVVDDVIAENKELFSYVDSRGLTWEEANHQARVIQRSYRRTRARRQLREKIEKDKLDQLGRVPIEEHSPSFIAYFESLGIDYESANKASLTIQSAFRTFQARKELKEMDRCSTHTIVMVAPDEDNPLVLEKPTFRNSKLLVYQESRSPSIHSGWYKHPTDDSATVVKEKRSVASSTFSFGLTQRKPFTRDSKLLVYQQSPPPSIDTVWYGTERKGTDVSFEASRLGLTKGMSYLEREDGDSPTLEAHIPTYFDADESKVPMISKSGQLDVVEEDVVTLFSTDTLKVSKGAIGLSQSSHSQKEQSDKLPSLKDLGKKPSKSESETAKELFSIIEKKISDDGNSNTGSLKSATKVEPGSLISRSIVSQKSEDSQTRLRIADSLTPSGGSLRPRASSRMLKMKLSSDEYETTTEP